MKASNLGNYYDDFVIGEEVIHSLSKTIFESDNNLFSLLTMNAHPLHTNAAYAAKSRHGRIVVVGTLVFSLAVGLTVPDISGKAIANLSYQNIEHLRPVFIGDTIYAKTKIISKRLSATNPTQGLVTVETIAFNQNNENVLKFSRTVLLPVYKNEIENYDN